MRAVQHGVEQLVWAGGRHVLRQDGFDALLRSGRSRETMSGTVAVAGSKYARSLKW